MAALPMSTDYIFSLVAALAGIVLGGLFLRAIWSFFQGFSQGYKNRQPTMRPAQRRAPTVQQPSTPSSAPAAGNLFSQPEGTPTASPPLAGNIFVSYRREDSPDVAGRIYDRLVPAFSKASVFKDIDAIPLGVDFREHLQKAVSRADVLLAVIGPRWLRTEATSTTTRLHSPQDFVRIELLAALERNIPVIPVLVAGASMPAEGDLPSELGKLAYRNAMQVRADPDFHTDMDRLIKGIQRVLPSGH